MATSPPAAKPATVHVQLVDPGGYFEHPEGSLSHEQVVELPRDERVSQAIRGKVLLVVPAPEKPVRRGQATSAAAD